MTKYSRRVIKVSARLLALLSVLVLHACGDKEGSTGEKTTIVFWHFQSEPGQKAALVTQIKAFEEANPELHVELQDLTWNNGKEKLLAAFSSNTAPDLVELGSDWVAQFSSAGVLADQSKLQGDQISRFPDFLVAPGKWENGVYAWPWVTDTRVLFVNKGLLAAAGVDTLSVDTLWSDVLAKAEKVSKPPGVYGFGANGDDEHRLYKKIIPFFWSNGGEVLDSSGRPAINSAKNVEALEMYLSLARVGWIDTQKGLDQKFLSGKVAYWISGPWLVDRIAKDNPSLPYGVAVMPKFPGGTGYSFAGGEYLAINEDSQQKDAAKKLITFLTSAKQAMEFAKALPGGTTPADLSIANDPFLQSSARKVFTAQLRSARMTPVHPQWLDIEKIIETEVATALLGRKDAKQALDDAQAQIVAKLGENGDGDTAKASIE